MNVLESDNKNNRESEMV